MAPLTPRERRQQAVRAIRDARRRRGLQKDAHAERVVGSLASLQQQVRQSLERQPAAFEQEHLTALLREVDAHLERWDRRAKGQVTEALEAAWEIAAEIVEAPFAAAGRALPRVLLPESMLQEFVADGVDLMDGLSSVAKTRVHEALELGLLGGKTPAQVMEEVGEQLSDPGPFRLISFRAETVTRTEMGRVHSKAGHRRMSAAARTLHQLEKEWVWSGKTRSAHQAVSGQRRLVEDPFDVGGQKLMYPRDPAGSAENTILCGCESVPWMPGW